jgi:hypothetical protein
VHQSLVDGRLPCVRTDYEISPDLGWRSEAIAVLADGRELVSFEHLLANRSNTALELVFGLALRPYNPLAIGHINRIRYKRRLWRVNRRPGFLLLEEPSRAVVSDRHHGDPLAPGDAHPELRSLISRSGIASGVAEFDVTLAPGEERTIATAAALARRPGRPKSKLRRITAAVLGDARAAELGRAAERAGEGMRVELPDPELENAFYAVKGHLHVFDDGDYFTPGTFLYHEHWFRDGAYLALAHDNLGLFDRVRPKLVDYLGRLTREGHFRSQTGEWDSNGQAMITIVDHVRKSGDVGLLATCYSALIEGAGWIEAMRARTKAEPSPHRGLLPAGISAEHFGPNDHYYWDNFWGLAGLLAAAWAARRLDRRADEAWLRAALADYRSHLASSMQGCFERLGGALLPCSPYRRMDSAAVGNLVAVSPLRLVSPRAPWVRGTTEYLIENNLRDGLFFQKIIHTGLNPYLSAQLARVLMAAHDDRGFEILEALRRRASPTFTWPEAIHPATGGGCMGDGDHGWSAAEFVNLVREMLVAEELSAVVIGRGIPERWLLPGNSVRVSGAPTAGGRLDFSLEATRGGVRLEWRLERHPRQEALPLYFAPRAPGLARPRWVRLEGARGEIRLRFTTSGAEREAAVSTA